MGMRLLAAIKIGGGARGEPASTLTGELAATLSAEAMNQDTTSVESLTLDHGAFQP